MVRKHSVINLKNMDRTLPVEYGVVLKISKKELYAYVADAEGCVIPGFVGSLIGCLPILLSGCLCMSNKDTFGLQCVVADRVTSMVNSVLYKASAVSGMPCAYHRSDPRLIDLHVHAFVDVRDPLKCTMPSLTLAPGLIAIRGPVSTMFTFLIECVKKELESRLVRGIPEIVLSYMYTYKLNV